MFVVDEGSVWPECAGDLFASEELAGPLQKHEEHLEGLGVQLNADALPTEFAESGICFEYSEAVASGWLIVEHILWPV